MPENPAPTPPATRQDRLIENFPMLTLSDAHMSIYRARALISLTEKFFALNEDGQERLPPSDLSFVLERAIDHLGEARDTLEGLVNTVLNRWTHVDPGDDWGRLRRLWARADGADQELLLRCAEVLDQRPQSRGALEALIKKLEDHLKPTWKREGPRATPAGTPGKSWRARSGSACGSSAPGHRSSSVL